MEDGELVGLGMSGFVGQLTERVRTYEGVRNRAEVWFDRVRCKLGSDGSWFVDTNHVRCICIDVFIIVYSWSETGIQNVIQFSYY